MTAQDQLAYETRVRPRQTLVAGSAALALVAAAAIQVVGPQSKVTELTVQLLLINKRFPLDLIGAVVQGVGVIALVWTLAFLFDCARARRPEMSSATRIVILVAGVVAAIGAIIYASLLAVKAHQFATQGIQTYPQAHNLTSSAALPVLQTLDIAAQFALDICLILICLNAMRVGLLTRFMGYTGIVVGIAGMLLIGSAPAAALEVFFMGALAYLFSGRWPAANRRRGSRARPSPGPRHRRFASSGWRRGASGPGPSLRRSLRPSRSPPHLPCARVRAPRSASASAATERGRRFGHASGQTVAAMARCRSQQHSGRVVVRLAAKPVMCRLPVTQPANSAFSGDACRLSRPRRCGG